MNLANQETALTWDRLMPLCASLVAPPTLRNYSPFKKIYTSHQPMKSGLFCLGRILPQPNVDPAKLKIVHPDFFRYVFAEYLDAVAYRPTTGKTN